MHRALRPHIFDNLVRTKLQAAIDAYRQMDDATRRRADALLSEIGGDALKTLSLPAHLTRRNYRLALA